MQELRFTGQTEELSDCLSYLSKDMDFQMAETGVEVCVTKQERGGLKVEISETGCKITYGCIPDFCRALCILLDTLQKGEKAFSVEESREIEHCGIMVDLSRNAVFKLETAKDFISRIARMGMNTFMLYIENIYKMEEYPYFGYMRGAYSEEELKEMDAFALSFGVEIVPCIQTLGHMCNALRWPYANNMKDTADVLLIDEPETYEFIEAMVRTMDRCLSTKRIHVGMDEAFSAGTGRYKAKHGYVSNHMDMIGGHLSKVKAIVDKYGKEPTMWCDMLMRYCSKTGAYMSKETVITPENAAKIPEGYVLAYWDYYFEEEDMYDAMIKCLKNSGRAVSFYGGIWTWGGLTVNYDKTFRTTVPAMKACRKNNVQEVYATLWGDDGAEVSYYTALLGMQLFAEYIYYENVDDEHLNNMFRVCTGYDMDSFLLLDAENFPETAHFKEVAHPSMNAVTMSKQLLYQDVLQGLLDKQYEHIDLKGHYDKILAKLPSAKVPADLQEMFAHYAQLIRVLDMKCDLGMRLTKNYKNQDKVALAKNLEEIKALIPEVKELHRLFAVLWLKDNKAFGLDRVDLRFGGLIARLERAAQRLLDYLNGTIDAVEELEEERLLFSTEEIVHCPFYNYYVTASMQIEKQW